MSKLQELARARNYFKLRLLGAYTPIPQEFLTQEESILLKELMSVKKALIDNLDKNSRKLGLKIPEHRCYFNCRNKAKFKGNVAGKDVYFCKKHFEEYLEIYE